MARKIRVGIDVGATSDPTAIVVTELRPMISLQVDDWTEPLPGWPGFTRTRRPAPQIRYLIRWAETLPLGMLYPDIERHIFAMFDQLEDEMTEGFYETPRVLVDATGVGRPVYDTLRLGLRGRAAVTGVMFTDGNGIEPGKRRGEVRLGKQRMAGTMRQIIERELIDAEDDAPFRRLVTELDTFERRPRGRGYEMGALRRGQRDDLVTALGLTLFLPYEEQARYVLLDGGDPLLGGWS